MTSLYLILLIGSLIVPLLFTIFKIDFIKNWRNFAISTNIIAIIFLVWDVIFTNSGIWGFSDKYCLGINVLKIPLEEILFFYIIPFCSLFTHFAFYYAFPNIKINKKKTVLLSTGLIALSVVVIYYNHDKSYTLVNFLILILVLVIGILFKMKALQQFYISFLIILVPFFIVNGILTGAITDIPIVWYNDLENLGIRLYTIPIEDIAYAFSMLFANLLIFNILNKKRIS